MGDLISRKALMRKLFFAEDGRKYPTRDIDNFPTTITFEDLRKVIRNQPTAYDVDKVIELMESLKANNEDAGREIDKFIRNQHIDICISIVKGAVKDE